MTSVWFTSDTHYGHQRMVTPRVDGHWSRPFANVDEMDEAMISAWNAVVRPGDTVYHLGDLSFRDLKSTQNITRRLNGQVHMVMGNHDRILRKGSPSLPNVAWYGDYKEIKVDTDVLESGKIVLMHYPLHVWNKSHYGSIHLHGHSHGSCPPVGRRMDVGVDTRQERDYAPYHLDEVLERMLRVEMHCVDHHTPRKRR